MTIHIPNWLIILSGVGQIFTALVYPYIRHQVFDWYNDVKKLKTAQPGNRENLWALHPGIEFFLRIDCDFIYR